MPTTPEEDRVLRTVYIILGRPSQQKLPYKDVLALQTLASMQILRLIASNPNHPYFSSLMTLVDVNDGDFLPKHEGSPGVPMIVPYPGGEARSGILADPDDIDSYKHDITTGKYRALYSGAVDQQAVAYNEQTKGGRISPTACRYSFKNGQFHFTGDSAKVPLVQIDRDTAASLVPEDYEPTAVRLVISWLGKPWDKFYPICLRFAQEVREDLRLIAAGSMQVQPLPEQ